MKAAKYWAAALFGDMVFFGAFHAWQVHGSEGAVNVFAFFAWSVALLSMLMGLVCDRTHFEKTLRPAGFAPYNFVTDFLAICCLAWVGMFWCAGIYAWGKLLMAAARERAPKKAGVAP